MTNKKPLGKYSLELAVAIKEYHTRLRSEDGSRRKGYDDPESAHVTQEDLAICARINPGTFSKILNGKENPARRTFSSDFDAVGHPGSSTTLDLSLDR